MPISSHGYERIDQSRKGKADYRSYRHVQIAEAVLGRPLYHIEAGHPDNEVVHHIDGNKLNNNNDNLLICTHRYHTALHARLEASPDWPQFKPRLRHPNGTSRVGKSGFKGVETQGKKFAAHYTMKGRKIYIGNFPTVRKAAHAYDEFIVTVRGPNWIANKSMGLL